MRVTKQRFEDGNIATGFLEKLISSQQCYYWSIWKITALCLKLIHVAVLEYLSRFLIEAISQVPAPVFDDWQRTSPTTNCFVDKICMNGEI